jgi:hypothetical protein
MTDNSHSSAEELARNVRAARGTTRTPQPRPKPDNAGAYRPGQPSPRDYALDVTNGGTEAERDAARRRIADTDTTHHDDSDNQP